MRLVLPLAQRTLQSNTSTMRQRAIVLLSSSSSLTSSTHFRRTYQTAAAAIHNHSSAAATPHHRRRQDTHYDNIMIRGVGVKLNNKNYYTTHSQLPSEHQMVYEMCRKFADEELIPNAGKWDKEHAFPVEAVNKLVRNSCSHCSIPFS